MKLEKELIKLYEEYLAWLCEVKSIVSEDMGEDFPSFIRWLKHFRI